MDVEGLVTIASHSGAEETLARMKAALQVRGLQLFAEIDHAKNAAEAGLTLSPCTVMIFGNAKAGTPLMQAQRSTGIDLPLKVLVWEDPAGKVWISYNDPIWIGRRHGLGDKFLGVTTKMRDGLAAAVSEAAGN
jgi:uncharacterized protein (DUF302 family)